jgi:hypothetical protein
MQKKEEIKESLQMYCFDLSCEIPTITTRIPIDVEICTHPVELENVDRDVVSERLSNGHEIFIARHNSKPVGYIFATNRNCWVGEVSDEFIVEPHEIYLYDAYTNVNRRGNRIYPFLLTDVVQFYREKDYSYALIFTTFSNKKSVKGITRAGFTCYREIEFYTVGGLSVWNYKPKSCDVKSWFSSENE